MRVWCLILVLVMHACLLPRTWLAQARAEMGPTAPHCPTCALVPACPLCEGALGEAELGGGCCCGWAAAVVEPPANGEIGGSSGCDSCRCEAWPLDPQPTNGSTISATAGSGAGASNPLMAMAACPWIQRLDWPTFVGAARGTHAERVEPGVVPRSVSCVRVV